MNAADAWTAARQWTPFVIRTVGYGTVSCLLGPLTAERRASLWAMRQWCVSSTRGLAIEVECEGAENVPESGSFVYCSNHQSLIDILILGAVLPGDYKWAAKRSLMRLPFLGWHLRLAGHVPVDRGSGGAVAEQVVTSFVEVLRRGKPLLIFPEGTRTLTGELKDFKPGAFRAAVRANVPVVPVALDGTFTMMSKGAFNAGTEPKRVRVRIGRPIPVPTEGDEASRVAALRDRSRDAISVLFESIRTRGRATPSADAEAAGPSGAG